VATSTREREINPWLVLLVLCLGFFMIMLDTTIVNVALPAMLAGLHASLDQIVWVVNAYLLAYSALLIPAGRLGDIFGQRNLFAIGLVIFTLASVACGLSQNPGEIITARVVQGVGGALLTPQTLTLISAIFPAEKRGAAMGIWGSVIGLSTVAGPTIGGVLVTEASWRWIFFVNVPIGIVALIGTARIVPDLRPGRTHSMDWLGVTLTSVGLFLIVFGLVEGQRYNWGTFWGPLTIPEVMILGGIVLAALMVWEWRAKEPVLPPALLRNRNYSVLIFIQALIAFGMLGISLPLILDWQSGLGMTALRAGLTLVPFSLATMVSAPLAGKLADRLGAKYLLMIGTGLFAAGIVLLIPATTTGAHETSFILPLVVGGLGLGMCMAPLTAEAMRQVQPQQLGAASGLLNTSRQVGGLIGTAVVTAILQGSLATHLASQARSTAASLSLPAAARDSFIQAFSHASAGGLQLAPGQAGTKLPAGSSPAATAVIARAAHDVFVIGLTDASKVTLWVPAAVVAACVICCLAIQSRRSLAAGTAAAPVAETAATAAAEPETAPAQQASAEAGAPATAGGSAAAGS